MLRQLIYSFMRQDYPNKELVISDDSPNDSLATLLGQFEDPRLIYTKNQATLGFARNLRQAITLAEGEYLMFMGDDDLFLSRDAISQYAATFDSNPSVFYVNCNKAQFSSDMAIESLYRCFPRDALFAPGLPSMVGIWTTSIVIAGIGLRNTPNLAEYYPDTDYLFPQVQCVGHVINHADSYGLAATLIGVRAHPDQLGFHAIRGERITGTERHGTLELFTILARLQKRYMLAESADFLARDLINSYKTNLLKEKLIVGKQLVRTNYRNFCTMSPLARKSNQLRLYYWMSQLVPAPVLRLLRGLYILLVRSRNRQSFAVLQRELVALSAPEDVGLGHGFT